MLASHLRAFQRIASSASEHVLKTSTMAESKPDYETRLSDAVEFYRQNSDAKYASVARQFEVSRETLRQRLNGRRPAKGKPATHSKLSKAEEEALCDYVDRLKKLQRPVYKEHVTDAANSIIKEHSSKLDTQPYTVGTRWTLRFLHRHNISVQRPHMKEKKRKAAENTETVPLDPQVGVEGLDHRSRTPELEPENPPANTAPWLREAHRISNEIIDSLKQHGPTDDLIQKVEELRDLAVHREAVIVQASARLQAKQRQKKATPSDCLAPGRRTSNRRLSRRVAQYRRCASHADA